MSREAKLRRDRAWAMAATILLAVLLCFWHFQLVQPSQRWAHDAFAYHYPSYLFNYSMVAAGSLPLWNPYQLCGIPTFATLQGGLLYPPHFLHLVLPTHQAMAISSFLHLALIALSTMVLARRARLGLPAALLAASLLTMRGAQPGHITNPSMQEAGAWLVVGFIGVLDLADTRLTRGLLLVSVATAMSLLAGFPQLTVYSAYAWMFLLLALVAQQREGRRRVLTISMVCAAGVALGTLIAAVQLLPSLELSSVGSRERGDLSFELMFGRGVPGFRGIGSALQSVSQIRPSVPDLAYGFGLTGLALLPAALVQRRNRSLAIALLLLGVLTLAFAVGPATPVFELLLKLPEVASFRNPWRVAMIADFCFALLAGIGLDALLRWTRREANGSEAAGWQRQPVRIVCIGTALGLGLWGPEGSGFLALAISAAVALQIAAERSSGLASVASLAMLTIALAEIFSAPADVPRLPFHRDTEGLRVYHDEPSFVEWIAVPRDRVWMWPRGDSQDLPEKLASVFRIRSITDLEVMTLRRQREYFSYLVWGTTDWFEASRGGLRKGIFYGRFTGLGSAQTGAGLLGRDRLVDLAAARYFVVPRVTLRNPKFRDYARRKGLEPIGDRDASLLLYENPAALPRAYITHRIREAPAPEELLARLSQPDFDPRLESFVEGAAQLSLSARREGASERVEIVHDSPDRVEIETELESQGLVVLADSHYPGWQASVDGQAVAIHATNHLFRGVAVPAGRHKVVFRYRPRSLQLGALASLLGIASLVAIGLRSRAS